MIPLIISLLIHSSLLLSIEISYAFLDLALDSNLIACSDEAFVKPLDYDCLALIDSGTIPVNEVVSFLLDLSGVLFLKLSDVVQEI